MSTPLAVDIAYQGKKGRSRRGYLSGPASFPAIASLRLSSAEGRARIRQARSTLAGGDVAVRKRARPYDEHGRHGLGSPSRGRRNTGVPDPEDVPPAVAATGTMPRACPGPAGMLRSSPSSQRSAVQKQEEIEQTPAMSRWHEGHRLMRETAGPQVAGAVWRPIGGDGRRAPGQPVTEPGGGMVPGPVTLQLSAEGSATASGWASRGGSANDGRRRSSMSSIGAAFASR